MVPQPATASSACARFRGERGSPPLPRWPSSAGRAQALAAAARDCGMSRPLAAGRAARRSSLADLPAPSVIPASWPRHVVRATARRREGGRRCCYGGPCAALRDSPLEIWLSAGLLATALCLAFVPTSDPYFTTSTFGSDVAAWLDDAIAAQDRTSAVFSALLDSFKMATRATRLSMAASVFGGVSQAAVVAYALCGRDQSARRSRGR